MEPVKNKKKFSSLSMEIKNIVVVSEDEVEEEVVDKDVTKGINHTSVTSSLGTTARMIKVRSLDVDFVIQSSTIKRTALSSTRSRGVMVRRMKVHL